MELTDSMRDTLDQLRTQERKLLDELNGLRFTIKNLERIAGVESQEASSAEARFEMIPPSNRQEVPATNGASGKSTIRPDEFFGLTHAEAARRYLKKIGHAVSFAEMVDVLRRGGCKLTSSDPEHVLWISLVKNSKDFVPPQPGFVGLKEFYPARAKAPDKTKAKTKKRGRAKKKASSKREAKTPKRNETESKGDSGQHNKEPEKPKEVGSAVHEFMSDKHAHSAEDVAKAVSEKLGRPVKLIAIRGTLRNKKRYEETDGKFRLIN